VSSPLKTYAKDTLLRTLSRVTGRHVVLLADGAVNEDSIMNVRAPYRVDGARLSIEVFESGPGQLSAELLAYAGHFPETRVWSGVRAYDHPCALSFDLVTGRIALADQEWGRVPLPLPARRFCWRLTLRFSDRRMKQRTTGHYVPSQRECAGSSYYRGDNYVDYESQAAGDHEEILRMLRQHGARGPVLDVGCATGGLLAVLDRAGFTSYGIDASEWAVEQARTRFGDGRAWVCDVEREDFPSALTAHRPFGTIVLAAILEHFHHPFAVLSKLPDVAAAGTLLVVTTTNAESLTHLLFGDQWEGYFDTTHHGIDQVNARRLREELARLGWRVERLTTHRVWDADADPTHATVREWWAADARFRQLLAEHDLGDLIVCVAVRA